MEKEKNFFEDLLDDTLFDDPEDENENGEDTELQEEEENQGEEKQDDGQEKRDDRSQKNRDAEEARKRREREKREREKVKEIEEESERVQKLGEQLVDFKKKYPNVDLAELDEDKNFKRFIEGKLLGKKDFTQLYEEYLEVKAELSGKTTEEIKKNYERKAQASSGSSIAKEISTQTDVYSEEEFKRITEKIPFMHPEEVDRIWEKYEKSLNYYKNKR